MGLVFKFWNRCGLFSVCEVAGEEKGGGRWVAMYTSIEG